MFWKEFNDNTVGNFRKRKEDSLGLCTSDVSNFIGNIFPKIGTHTPFSAPPPSSLNFLNSKDTRKNDSIAKIDQNQALPTAVQENS